MNFQTGGYQLVVALHCLPHCKKKDECMHKQANNKLSILGVVVCLLVYLFVCLVIHQPGEVEVSDTNLSTFTKQSL